MVNKFSPDRYTRGSSAMPKFGYGINISASWKNFDLSMLWAGNGGIHRYITDIRLPYFLTVFLHPTGFILTQIFCYLIMIVREIGRNSIIEITYMVFPAYSQFKTAVRNLSRIHGRRSLSDQRILYIEYLFR